MELGPGLCTGHPPPAHLGDGRGGGVGRRVQRAHPVCPAAACSVPIRTTGTPVARSLRSLCGPDLHCSILEGGAELSWRLSGSQGAGAAPGAQGGGEAPLHGIPAGWCVPGPGLTAVVSVSLQPHDGPAGKALFLTPVRKRSAGAEPLTALSASCQLTCARRGFQRDPVAFSRALAAPGVGQPRADLPVPRGREGGGRADVRGPLWAPGSLSCGPCDPGQPLSLL